MEDRFKFRAWHKPTKKMFKVYGFNYDFVFEDTMDGVETTPYNPARFKDCILMQCTSYKDANEKLIYEGDIIIDTLTPKAFKKIFAVAWNDNCGCFTFEEPDGNRTNAITAYNSGRFEIIGNLCETPENYCLKKQQVLKEVENE